MNSGASRWGMDLSDKTKWMVKRFEWKVFSIKKSSFACEKRWEMFDAKKELSFGLRVKLKVWTLGGVKSLVPRYIEGYSFLSTWGP